MDYKRFKDRCGLNSMYRRDGLKYGTTIVVEPFYNARKLKFISLHFSYEALHGRKTK
jgi:hypothetical protein